MNILLEKIQGLKIENIHTDNFVIYHGLDSKYENHTTNKENTTQVESFNAVLRNNIPFLIRKSKA